MARETFGEQEGLGAFHLHDEESEANKEGSAEEIEGSYLPPRSSRRVERTPKRFYDTSIVVAENYIMYDEAMEGREKSEWELTQEGDLNSINRSKSWITTVLQSGQAVIKFRVVLKQRRMSKDVLIETTHVLSQRAASRRNISLQR